MSPLLKSFLIMLAIAISSLFLMGIVLFFPEVVQVEIPVSFGIGVVVMFFIVMYMILWKMIYDQLKGTNKN